MNGITEFAKELFENGEAWLSEKPNASMMELPPSDELQELIISFHEKASLAAPGRPPSLDMTSAVWALNCMYWACWMLVDRNEAEVCLPTSLRSSAPDGTTAEQHWSVDLSFRFISQLRARGFQLSQDDPWVMEVDRLIQNWPLAALGTSVDESEVALSIVMQHPTLRSVYLDRILARKDNSRATKPEVVPWMERWTYGMSKP